MQKPREIAARVLQRRAAAFGAPLSSGFPRAQPANEAGTPSVEFTETLLERALTRAKLSAPDRRLCHEITLGIVRWQAALDWLITRKTNGRAQKPLLQILLRLGLYQIFWLDRIPPHAAVYETVELAKHNGLGAQTGFLNSVLRGCLREFDETKRLLADLKTSQPALGWSHPEWLYERWKNRWGVEKAARLMEWNNAPPKTCARVSMLKSAWRGELHESQITSEETGTRMARPSEGSFVSALLEQWRGEGVEFDLVSRDWLPDNLVFELNSHPPLSQLESFRQGRFYIQDPGTMLAVHELDPQPGETILDFCAAPGGKTTFIAQLMNNHGCIVAQDVSRERLKLVEENCARLGVTCAKTILNSKFEARNSQFDRVLVDVPCSNTGVMRRRVDLRWRIQPDEIKRLRAMQLDLLRQAASVVKPGGALVYSTCSLEPDENSEVVQEFLSGQANFKLERERELLPFTDAVDGAFVARFLSVAI